jgi:hypothetical protein
VPKLDDFEQGADRVLSPTCEQSMTRTVPPTTTRARRKRSLWISVLAALCGLPVMLLTIAIGAGDTSVGNSSGPWVEGDAILVGIPLAVGVISYVAIRRSGASRLQAVVGAVVIPPAMFIAAILIFVLLVQLS